MSRSRFLGRLARTVTAAALLVAAPGMAPAAGANDVFNGGRLAGGSSQFAQQAIDLPGAPLPETSRTVELNKYAGTWYQVASVPQPYTLQCVRDVTARYAVKDAKTISVRNSCGTLTGSPSTIKGTATVKSPASLRVNFPGVPFQDPNGPTNYRITYLAKDYSLAIVGDPDRKSGFVLSRSPRLSASEWDQVRNIVTWRGWNPCTFLTVPMSQGRQDITPVCAL